MHNVLSSSHHRRHHHSKQYQRKPCNDTLDYVSCDPTLDIVTTIITSSRASLLHSLMKKRLSVPASHHFDTISHILVSYHRAHTKIQLKRFLFSTKIPFSFCISISLTTCLPLPPLTKLLEPTIITNRQTKPLDIDIAPFSTSEEQVAKGQNPEWADFKYDRQQNHHHRHNHHTTSKWW